MDFYTLLEFGDDRTFIKDRLVEYFDWAEMDGEEGITKLFNIIHDFYKDNELINSCLIECIFDKIGRWIELGNLDIVKDYLNLFNLFENY